ncbi:MAG: prephenate dehydrogenase/arogenate dehydrogenase family protein [Proteobacteria bacterium]|nr:prephenate dehydrogenase/arogenate dehydrogenase family protein [Pseudomonadota bacterium]
MPNSRPHWHSVTDPRLGVIGGAGRMGQLFRLFFADRGFDVRYTDVGRGVPLEELVAWADVLLFAVPLRETVPIIQSTVPLTREGQLLLDVTSLKRDPVAAMMESDCDVLGLHPMFGPPVPTFAGQTVIVCQGRGERNGAIVQLLRDARMRLKEATAEEHDRMMSVIQVLVHFHTICLGRTLRELGVDIGGSLEWTSPIYRLEMTMAGRLFAQDPELYAAIEELNPHAIDVVDKATESVQFFSDCVRRGDFESFVEDFRSTSEFMGDFCAEAQILSKTLIRHLP